MAKQPQATAPSAAEWANFRPCSLIMAAPVCDAPKEARQADTQTDSRRDSSCFNVEIAIFTICFDFRILFIYVKYIYLPN